MSELDDLATRAVRAVQAEADALGSTEDALARLRPAPDALVIDLADRAAPERQSARRPTAWKAMAGVAAAGLVIVGVGVALSGGDEPDTLATEQTAAPSTLAVDPSAAPIPIDGDELPDGWVQGPAYYLGSGLSASVMPGGYTLPAEEAGAVVRKVSGFVQHGPDRPLATNYVTSIDQPSTGQSVTIGLADGPTPPAVVRRGANTAIVTRDISDGPNPGAYTLIVVADGFGDDRRAAQRIADGLEFDPSLLLDRFDVPGGFDSVIRTGGYSTTGSWSLLQGMRSNGMSCMRLVVSTDGTMPGGYSFCLPAADGSQDQIAYLRVGGRRFVVAIQAPGTRERHGVLLRGGSTIDIFRDGWVGPIVQEIQGKDVVALDATAASGCPIDKIADVISLTAIAIQVTDCDDSGAAVTFMPSAPDRIAIELRVERDGSGGWANPLGPERIYLGAGLFADALPAAFQRTGGLLGGPFTMDVGGSVDSHAVTISSRGFGPSSSVQIGYVADGVPGAAFDGSVVAARRAGSTTLWAASDDLTRDQLQAIVDGLGLERDFGADDGEPGEFGSVLVDRPAARGWTEWTLMQGERSDVTCYVLRERVFGRRPPDAVEFCVPPAFAPTANRTVVVRGANTYVIDIGVLDIEPALPSIVLDDGTVLEHEQVRATDLGPVSIRVVPAGSRIADVAPLTGDACPYAELVAPIDDVDAASVAYEIGNCTISLLART